MPQRHTQPATGLKVNKMCDRDYYIKCREIFGDPYIIERPLIAYTHCK